MQREIGVERNGHTEFTTLEDSLKSSELVENVVSSGRNKRTFHYQAGDSLEELLVDKIPLVADYPVGFPY